MVIYMGLLEIILIIIGIVIIIISCRMVGNSQEKEKQLSVGDLSLDAIFSDVEMKRLKEEISELLRSSSEETIDTTEDSLSRLSNEKIMAVSEFSDQVLEKINRNHEEVVFLYNMLNEKEKDLKETVKEISKVQQTEKETSQSVVERDTAVPINARPSKQPDRKPSKSSIKTETVKNETANNNEQILSLYSEGKSIVEISKLLDLGQGEVKLVIDLFYGKK